MQFATIIAALFAGAAFAAPATSVEERSLEERQFVPVCSGTYGSAQVCFRLPRSRQRFTHRYSSAALPMFSVWSS
jgi:hypothetical protein